MSFAEFLERLQSSLVVRHIATSRPDLRTASPDDTAEAVQALMETEDFDVMPVDDKGTIDHYFERQAPGPPAQKTVAVADVVSADLPLLELIDHFAASRRRFYLTLGGRRIDGIVTRADLNKLAVRVLIYAILNRLELLLKALVEDHYDAIQWLDLLSERDRAKVQERLDKARSGNVELRPAEYLDLSDLVEICKKTPETWETLGVRTKKNLKSRYGSLVDLRHNVAHPVRSLVSASDDVARLWKQIDAARSAITTLEQSLGPT